VVNAFRGLEGMEKSLTMWRARRQTGSWPRSYFSPTQRILRLN